MVQPLRPEEMTSAKAAALPQVVIQAFNESITDAWDGSSATVYKDNIVEKLMLAGITREEIQSKHMLDVEPIYREQGWKVVYDGPAYNESYRGFYVFSKK